MPNGKVGNCLLMPISLQHRIWTYQYVMVCYPIITTYCGVYIVLKMTLKRAELKNISYN